MNKAVIIGHVTKDPESRTTQAGIPVCTFTVAVNRRKASANGERDADFIPIVTWRGLAENCAKYLRKGSHIAVYGSIQTRSYEGNDGARRYVTEIIADDVQFLSRTETERQPEGMTEVQDNDLPF